MPFKQKIKKFLMHNPSKANYKFVIKDWVSLTDLNALSKVLESKRFSQNLAPLNLEAPFAKNILFFAPHPDDDVISSGGTLLKLRQKEAKIKVIYVTSGVRPTYQDKDRMVLSEDAKLWEGESRQVSGILGTDIEFWRDDLEAIKIDAEKIKKVRAAYDAVHPEVIFVPFLADDHDDHRRTAQLFYEAFRGTANLDSEVWAYQVYSSVIPNAVIDITDSIEEKVELIRRWKTQMARRDWSHYIKGLNAFNSRFLKTKKALFAECFFVVPAKEYVELCRLYFSHHSRELYYSHEYKNSR